MEKKVGFGEKTRILLKELPTGKIELVWNGLWLALEFNASCLDCLPYCRALCCRLRTGFSVILTDEEVEQEKFKMKPHTHQPLLRVLDNKPDMSCVYLQGDNLCQVHKDKPQMCRDFHCSPGGVGEGISYRNEGWLLTPVLREEVRMTLGLGAVG